jgi:D-alanine-D-alanine ligase
MRRKVRNVGIVLETREDALALGRPLSHLYHWREPEEIEAVTGALGALGFVPRLLGTPAQVAQRLAEVRGEVEFVFNISVGFVTRYRMALGPSLYALAGLPYSGADPYGKMVSQNKQLTYGLLGAIGMPVPEWRYCDTVEDALRLEFPGFPAIVKPAWEGASIGLDADAVVGDTASLRALARRLIETLGMPVVVQRFIQGRELKVGILGDAPTLFEGIIEDTGADGSPGSTLRFAKAPCFLASK